MFNEQESNEFRLPADLAALAAQLAGLTAAAPRVDRDRLMFEAGQAAGSRSELRRAKSELLLRSRFWPMATAAMTAATVLLAATLARQSHWVSGEVKRQVVDVVAAVNVEAKDTNQFAAYPVTWMGNDRTPPGYLGIRYVALTRGVDALAREFSDGRGDGSLPMPPADSRQMLQELLPTIKQKSI
jgi:hypothetical protein